MRSLMIVLILCLITSPVFAGDQTLVTEHTRVGGYVAPIFLHTEIDEDFALFVGGRVLVIFNHNFAIGGGGYGIVNEVYPEEDMPGVEKIRMAYGGLILEYMFNSQETFHFAVLTLIGAGKLSFKGEWEDEEGRDSDIFFALEPEFDVEVNISRNVRFTFGATYRFVGSVELGGITETDLKGTSIMWTLKVGGF